MCVAVVALLLGSESWPPAKPAAPLVGFSYSPLIAEWAGRDPTQDLAALLDTTEPDLVRLPVYWESVEPTPETLDFSSVDQLLAVVEQHNVASNRPTRVVLTIGARNFLYPELHEPDWAAPRQQPHLNDLQSAAAYRAYFDGSLMRYRSSPLLYAWQVENEPFDYVVNDVTGADQITPQQLAWEIDEVHRLDPAHEAVTTSFDGWNVTVDMFQKVATPLLTAVNGRFSGHPTETLAAGDALGLDLYIDGPSTPFGFTNPDLRSVWKQQAVDFWAGLAKAQGKGLWLTEVQAQPWDSDAGFTPANLYASAVDYRQEPVQVVLLWGAETWLDHSVWMDAAAHAMAILRS